jgi:hypothetical protein
MNIIHDQMIVTLASRTEAPLLCFQIVPGLSPKSKVHLLA